MKRRLTDKQRELVKASIENPRDTLSELAVKSGYSCEPAVSRALSSPGVKAKIQEMMDRRPKLRDDAFLDHLENGMEAEKQSATGENIADWGNRHKYFETGLKLKGALTPDMEHGGLNIQIVIGAIKDATQRGL